MFYMKCFLRITDSERMFAKTPLRGFPFAHMAFSPYDFSETCAHSCKHDLHMFRKNRMALNR